MYAHTEAQARFGVSFAGKAIAIVGDTDLDITCGTRWGARAIGVATGPQPLAALALCGADHLFPDLADTAAVLAALLG